MKYALLWECWHSGQMTEREMQEHMREDPAFAEYVRARV